jgi:gluconokinase
VFFAELTASRDELLRRMGDRGAHFMPASLLDSQLATLESLQPDEPGVRIGGLAPADAVAASIAGELTSAQSLR